VVVKPLEPNSQDNSEDATIINFEGFSKLEWHAISYLRYAPTSVYFAHDLLLDTDWNHCKEAGGHEQDAHFDRCWLGFRPILGRTWPAD
jgi:hypothetical protein